MNLEPSDAFVQVVDAFDDPAYPVRIAMVSVTDPTETPVPVVWMTVAAEEGPDGYTLVQVQFTRDQMREHIVACQKVLGLLS